MSQNPNNHWLNLLLLGVFFGLLYALSFLMPHYTPVAHEEIPAESPYSKEAVTHADISEQEETISDTKNKSEKLSAGNRSQSVKDFFDSLKKQYQTDVLNELNPDKPRKDVIIRYYKHPPDGDKVYVLRDLGFYIHERPVDQVMTKYESNSIFYGDSIKKEDLLIVAYTLIQQGIPIKNIQPSLYHDGWKYNAIEIGADSTVIDQQVLTLDELQNYPL